MSALQAFTQVDPPGAFTQAVLAAERRRRSDISDRAKVTAHSIGRVAVGVSGDDVGGVVRRRHLVFPSQALESSHSSPRGRALLAPPAADKVPRMVADREYLAVDPTVSSDVAAAVQAALAKAGPRVAKQGSQSRGRPRASVVTDPPAHLRRTWYDTFDWRLHKANLTLQRIESGRSNPGTPGRLVLASTGDAATPDVTVSLADGGPAEIRAARPFDSVVPPGAIRNLLEPIVEMRALSTIVTLRTVVRTYRVRNEDEKTVARVVVEHEVGDPVGGIGCRVSVVACRGYDAEAAATARVVAKVPGIAVADQSMFAQAVSAIGRSPGDYSSKLDIALTVGMPTTYAIRRVMRALLDAAERNVPGVLADTDTEFLHDLRVAIRRGRSTLKIQGISLPAAQTDAATTALKWLGDVTTPTRDLDVYVLGLDNLAAEVAAPGWDASQLDPFRDFLATHRAKEQAALVRTLRSARAKRAFGAWATVSSGGDSDDGSLGPPIESVARAAVARAFKRVVKAGSVIDAGSAPAQLHGLRKRCKELRYTLEIFAALHDPLAQRALVDDLKKLQDCLGEFQDTEVQQHAIRRFATQMLAEHAGKPATVEAVMAMGRLADRLGERQVVARNTFASLFDRFAGPIPRAHLAALYEGAA
jgi:CHAD domain-containing protein